MLAVSPRGQGPQGHRNSGGEDSIFGEDPTLTHFPFGPQGAVLPGVSLPPVSKTLGVGWDTGWAAHDIAFLWRQSRCLG